MGKNVRYMKIPQWAYGDSAKKTEPPESVKEKGWSAEDAPSAEVFNWWMNEISESLEAIRDFQITRVDWNSFVQKKIEKKAAEDRMKALSEISQTKNYFRRLKREMEDRFELIINVMEEIHPKTPKSKFYHLHKSKRG